LCSVKKRLRSMFSLVRLIDSSLLKLLKCITLLIVSIALYEIVIVLRLKGQAPSPPAFFKYIKNFQYNIIFHFISNPLTSLKRFQILLKYFILYVF